jgi:hypothetical protein
MMNIALHHLQYLKGVIYVRFNFISKPANSWIKEASLKPILKILFSEFWFEGEICILFADTNVGKAI